jgi:hypothetical protein
MPGRQLTSCKLIADLESEAVIGVIAGAHSLPGSEK